jgi:hypothetical protein
MTDRTPFEISQTGCRTPDEWQSTLERLVPAPYGEHAEAWRLLSELPQEFGRSVWNLRYERELSAECSLEDALACLEHHQADIVDRLRKSLARADQALGRERFVHVLRRTRAP